MGGQYNTCGAINCTNSRNRISNLPMFRVPKDPIRSKEWIKNSGRKELLLKDPNYLYDNIRFCAFHFEDSQFTNSNKNRLIWKAVPTLFSPASDVGLDQTKITDYQSMVNHVEPERNTNRTFVVLKKLSLPKQKSLIRDFKSTILKGKFKALRQIERQSSIKHIETKSSANPTHKGKLLTKLVSQRSHKGKLLTKLVSQRSGCQFLVKQTGNKTISSPNNEEQIMLSPSENNSSFTGTRILNRDTLEYKKKVDRECNVKRKLSVKQNKSINKTSKPISVNKKLDALQLNKCPSSANHIETKDTTNHIDGVDIQDNELGRSIANYIEIEETKNITNEVDFQENEGQSSVNHSETKGPTNSTDAVNMQENKFPSSADRIETSGTINTTDDFNNESQSSGNNIETKGTTNQTDKADTQENNGESSASHIEIKEIRPQTNTANEVNVQKNEGQSSANRNGTKGLTNHTGKADLQKKKGQSLTIHIETKGTTNITDEVNSQENEGLSSANCTEAKGTIKTTDKVNIKVNEEKSPANHFETKETTNPSDVAAVQENEGQSLANCNETKGIANSTNEAVTQEIEGQSSINHIASMTTSITNSTDEVDIQTKSYPQIKEHESSDLLSSVKQIGNIRISNSVDKLKIKSHSPENNSLVLNCDSSQNKKKILAGKRKSSLLKNSYGKRIQGSKPSIPKKKFEALKENECQSSVKCSETKKKIIHTDKVDKQENASPKIVECYSLLKNSKSKGITRTIDKVHQVKLGQQRIDCQSSSRSLLKHMTKKRIPDSNENVQTELSSPESNNSLLINDDFSQYKKRVEDFKKKLCSPNFNATVNRTYKRKFEALKGSECGSLLGLKKTEFKRVTKSDGVGDLQIKSNIQKIVCTPSVSYFETKGIINTSHEIQIKPISPENNSLITKVEVTKYKNKLEACEKVIGRLKTEHKSEVKKLRKVIKELRRRTRRKDFLISKLRKERKELKDGSYYVRQNIKPNFQRDRHLIEQMLSKYVSRDTLNIVVSQIRKPTTNFGNRWDDEVKMFALNILQSSPKAYKILCSYLHLPSTRTLQKFVQGADLMALSGLNYKISSDFAGDNEDDTAPENSSVVDADTTPNDDMTDPEMVSSVVEVESEDVILPECLISQDTVKEDKGQIIYVVTGSDNECEVITEDWIPGQDSNP